MNINRTEVLRYLGYGGKPADETVSALVENCIAQIQSTAQKKYIYQIFPCQVKQNTVFIGPMEIQSKNLSKNLAGCQEAILFAATLGSQPDFLLKKYSRLDMATAVVMQAASAAVIEAYCDQCQQEIEEQLNKQGKFLRPRFSPGYGDFSLAHQVQLTALLDCPRKIGLTLTKSFLMVPSKSVTAVMGISEHNEHCHKQGCEVCKKTNCLFRRG